MPRTSAFACGSRLAVLLDDLLIFVLAITGALVLGGFCVRLWREAADLRDARFRARWEPVLHARMSGDMASLPKLLHRERLSFLALWLHVLGYVRDEAAAAVVAVASELRLASYVVRLLGSRSDWKRAIAVQAAGILRLDEARGLLVSQVEERHLRSSLAAVRALLSIDPDKGLEGLEQLLRRPGWPAGGLHDLVKTAGPRADRLLSSLVLSALPGRATQLVRLIELTGDVSALPALRERLGFSRDEEEVAALVHALGRLGRPEDRAAITSLVLHPHWLVRMQAACALGTLGDQEDLTRLVTLLRDRVWWVRYRAAQSMLRVMGAAAIASMRATEPDRYAGEMLQRVLDEGG
jgi:hypothetical protein